MNPDPQTATTFIEKLFAPDLSAYGFWLRIAVLIAIMVVAFLYIWSRVYGPKFAAKRSEIVRQMKSELHDLGVRRDFWKDETHYRDILISTVAAVAKMNGDRACETIRGEFEQFFQNRRILEDELEKIAKNKQNESLND